MTATRLMVQLDGTNYLQLAEVEAWTIPTPGVLVLAAAGGIGAMRRRR